MTRLIMVQLFQNKLYFYFERSVAEYNRELELFSDLQRKFEGNEVKFDAIKKENL